ncbi:hypothetical protein STEG23_035060, partial [Scotinomys teguina]
QDFAILDMPDVKENCFPGSVIYCRELVEPHASVTYMVLMPSVSGFKTFWLLFSEALDLIFVIGGLLELSSPQSS